MVDRKNIDKAKIMEMMVQLWYVRKSNERALVPEKPPSKKKANLTHACCVL
jgi:hypothetical protein